MKFSVTVSTANLLNRLKENRANHIAKYDEAMAGYRKKAAEWLRRRATRIEAGETTNIYMTLDQEPPELHAGEYDTVIEMLEMGIVDMIILTHEDATKLLSDRWQWSPAFSSSCSSYALSSFSSNASE